MKITLGVFAHVDAGKTTFSEQLLYHAGMIREVGRVDHQDTALDTHQIEKERGITVFADQAYFTYGGREYYLIDSPGHVDFSVEMERTIGILDCAVILISGIDGVQGHTETVYELLKEAGIPVMFFINKMDHPHADRDRIIEALKLRFGPVVDFDQVDFEALADHSDALMEAFFDDRLEEDFFLQGARGLFMEGKIHPVLSGSALKDQGMDRFLLRLSQLTETAYPEEGFAGRVYKVRYQEGARQTYVKLTAGKLQVRDLLGNEKITGMRRVFGNRLEQVAEVQAGDLAVLTGLSLKVGQAFGSAEGTTYSIMPPLQTRLVFDQKLNVREVFLDMKVLEDEDPSLAVAYSPKGEITLRVMGTIQLEVLAAVIPERFGYQVDFENPTTIYKETIQGQVTGYGHFEPLKHYAEVILIIHGGQRGSGIVFHNACSADHLTVGQQNLVKHHIFERVHRGILTGSDLTDLEITLVTGRAHNKHTEGGDFREATIRALRQGLEQADNILLEPIYEAVITVPFTDMGKVLTDIQALHGRAEAEQAGDWTVITARVPVSTFKDYQIRLTTMTNGRGRMKAKVIGYEPCHNTEEVIASMAYDKVTDTEYPSSSVFCSKGKGYTVPWDQAEGYMHCLK